MKIVKGMPGLKQAARLENERLVHHLAPYGYVTVQHTPSSWKNESNGILFALVVDDFGIKSTSDSATIHLLQALRDKYQITVDPSGIKFLVLLYIGITLPEKSICQYQITSNMPSTESSIPCLHAFNMPHTATTNQCMTRGSNLLNHRTTQEKFSSQPQPKTQFSKSLECFYIMESLWTWLC